MRPEFAATNLLPTPQLSLSQRSLIHSPSTALNNPAHLPVGAASHTTGLNLAAAAIYQQYGRTPYMTNSPAPGNFVIMSCVEI